MSNEAKDMVRKMLQKSPSQRPSAFNLLKHDWFTTTLVFEEKHQLDHKIS